MQMHKQFLFSSILGLLCMPALQNHHCAIQAEESNQAGLAIPPKRSATNASGTQSPAIDQWSKVERSLVRDGISLQLELDPLEKHVGSAPALGHALRIRLSLHDAATRAPLTGLHPAMWMSLRQQEEVPCSTRARAFLRKSMMEKQADLDLTDYYVLVLNQDRTLHVVDPQFSLGRPRLVASIELPGRADDWVLSSDQSRLYVSISQPGEIVMIDTATWTIVHRAQISGAAKLVLQPDEHYLWSSSSGAEPGVAVLSATDLKLVARIPLHPGRHDIAIGSDSRLAFITDPAAATVAIIDVGRLKRTSEVKTQSPASAVAYSAAAQAAYVTTTTGSILAIGERGEIIAHLQAGPGLARIAFFGDGHFGIALNPTKGLLHVIDTARNTLAQTARISSAPEQIAFSDQMAYVVRRDSDLMEMVPLDRIGAPGRVSTVDLPAGHSAFSHASADELTTTMIQAPGENAVVIANAADKAVFYYEEGMAAPMGTFSNFGKSPRSVLVVDRSLKEKSPGIYEAIGRLEKPGAYVVPVLIDSPRMVECFSVPIGVDDTDVPVKPAHQ
jgi:DNA-binding beta-propeller fold protein YncE